MCRYIEGNKCLLGEYCHCHPVRDHQGYDDGYAPESSDSDEDYFNSMKDAA